jgi:hypothetical protein
MMASSGAPLAQVLKVVGVRDFGAQQQQGCGKDDAGHAVPPPMARRAD